jgi:hypothetical protein
LEIIPLFFCYCLNSGAIWRRRLNQRRFIGTTGYSRKELQNSGVTGYVLKPAECSDESRDVLLFSNLLFYNSYLVVAVATCYSFLEVTG